SPRVHSITKNMCRGHIRCDYESDPWLRVGTRGARVSSPPWLRCIYTVRILLNIQSQIVLSRPHFCSPPSDPRNLIPKRAKCLGNPRANQTTVTVCFRLEHDGLRPVLGKYTF